MQYLLPIRLVPLRHRLARLQPSQDFDFQTTVGKYSPGDSSFVYALERLHGMRVYGVILRLGQREGKRRQMP